VSSQYGRERGGRPWALLRLSSQLPDLPRGRLGAPTAIYLTTGCGLSLCAEVPDSLEECLDLYCNAGANEVQPPPPGGGGGRGGGRGRRGREEGRRQTILRWCTQR